MRNKFWEKGGEDLEPVKEGFVEVVTKSSGLKSICFFIIGVVKRIRKVIVLSHLRLFEHYVVKSVYSFDSETLHVPERVRLFLPFTTFILN